MSPDNPTVRIAGLENDSITNGPGLRFVIFVQGCPMQCEGCHNPQAQSFEGGTDMTTHCILEKIKNNPLITGVTFSGGEPFAHAKDLVPLARSIKELGLELACYTGYTFEGLLVSKDKDIKNLLISIDTLIDGPFNMSDKSYDIGFRGSKNQRFLDVSKSLAQKKPMPDSSGRWEI